MRILVVDDEADMRGALAARLGRAGHQVTLASCGMEGFDKYRTNGFDVVIADWRMEDLSGLDLCRMIRSLCTETYTYVIILTAAKGTDHLIEALEAGADDFMNKPFDAAVLKARLLVAERILKLHSHVTALEGILSVCSYCKQIRKDDGSWVAFESYLQERSALKFSHGICQGCMTRLYPAGGLSPASAA